MDSSSYESEKEYGDITTNISGLAQFKAIKLLEEIRNCPHNKQAKVAEEYLLLMYYYGRNNAWWVEQED